MDRFIVIRNRSSKGPQLCYSREGELFMNKGKAFAVRAVLKSYFPMEEYSVYKEVKSDAKKRNGTSKDS